MVILSTLICSNSVAKTRVGARPIEIKSDPYNSRNPTHYSIIRGTTKITFSHPFLGQFSRAEISTRENNGTKLTRFLLTKDRKKYRPMLQAEIPFESHGYEKPFCADPDVPSELKLAEVLGPKINDAELIAKKRDELVKANFFDTSCFDDKLNTEHRNAIMNAAADVLATETQNQRPEPKYLMCLEKHGFAHEAGIVQAWIKQSVSETKLAPRVRVGCTTKLDAPEGEFPETTKLITLKRRTKPVRENYAAVIFHELIHSAPLRDGTPLKLMEECCTLGEQCSALKLYGEQRRKGEKAIALMEATDPAGPVATSIVTALKGADNEAQAFAKTHPTLAALERQSEPSVTPACNTLGPLACNELLLWATENSNKRMSCPITETPVTASRAAYCSEGGVISDPDEDVKRANSEYERAISKYAHQSYAEVAQELPQNTPIQWEAPKEETIPVRLGSRELDPAERAPPSRTIASISPLPDEVPTRRMGAESDRTDVSTGNATMLVDTLENAAKKVTTTMTPPKMDSLTVDKKDVFAPVTRSRTKTPEYFVSSSIAKPIQIADISGIKDLSFKNPFASVDTITATKLGAPAKNGSPGKATSPKVVSPAASPEDRTPNDVAASDGGVTGSVARTGSSAPPTRSVGSSSNNRVSSASRSSPHQSSSTSKTHKFKAMDKAALLGFLTSTFRTVSTELDNPEFVEALSKNGIQIHDHENRRIGANKPETTLIYSSEKGRLIQTRVTRGTK